MEKRIFVLITSMICALQAHEDPVDVSANIEQQDLEHKRAANTVGNLLTFADVAALNTAQQSTPGAPRDQSAGHAGVQVPGNALTKEGSLTPPSAATSNGNVAGLPGTSTHIVASDAIANLDITPGSSTGGTGPANRSISNALSDNPLLVTLASLLDSAFSFSGFTGSATGGTFSNSNTTLSNTLATQATGNTASGILYYQFGYASGATPFTGINLTGGTVTNATVTGASTGNYFTGTNFETGTISQGNFDVVFITIPAGAVFNIITGDLGPTGKFTTTVTGYAYLTGATNLTSITDGTISLVGLVPGTYTYEGTNFPNGFIYDLTLTGVYAAGTSPDVNHFDVTLPATGTIGTPISISKALATNVSGTLYISAGIYAGDLFTGASGVDGSLSNGTFNSHLTGYNGTTIILTSSCIDGYINTGSGPVNIYYSVTFPTDIVITNANVSGTTEAITNGAFFTGTQIVTGTISTSPGDFQPGSCP